MTQSCSVRCRYTGSPGRSRSPHTWSQCACVGSAKSMSAMAYPCSASAAAVGTTSAEGLTAALNTAGSCATARSPTLTQTPGSTTNVAVGCVTTKDAREFSIRRGRLRPSTIKAVGTERGTCLSGETDTVAVAFGSPAFLSDARNRASARRGRMIPAPRPRRAPQHAATDGDLTSLDIRGTLEL